ncbi:MAG: TRAP transporter small permease [Pseudomonadota bacterium]
MRRILSIFHALVGGLSMLGDKINVVTVAFMTLSVFYNVLMRYIFNKPTIWAEEINSYLVVLMTCAGAAELMKKRQHISLNLFTHKLNAKTALTIESILLFAALLWSFIITWKSFGIAMRAFRYGMRESSPLLTPLVIPYSFFVFGFLVLTFQLLSMLIKNVENKSEQ